jgi:hypothetical protein
MPRGNRVMMLRTMLRNGTDENGETIETGYKIGEVHNLPPHIARALVKKGYAEFYHAPKKA